MSAVARRTWPRALGLAALTLWVPALLPYLIGPLRECDHCMATYAMCLPIVPGIFLPIVFALDDAPFALVGALTTLSMLGGLAAAMRYLSLPWSRAAQTAVILAVGFVAMVFSTLLRA